MGSKRNVLLINVSYWSHLDRGDVVEESSSTFALLDHPGIIFPVQGPFWWVLQICAAFQQQCWWQWQGPGSPGACSLPEWGWAGLPHLSWHLGSHLVPSPGRVCFLLCKGSFWRSQGLAARLPLIPPAGKQEACVGCRGNGGKLC